MEKNITVDNRWPVAYCDIYFGSVLNTEGLLKLFCVDLHFHVRHGQFGKGVHHRCLVPCKRLADDFFLNLAQACGPDISLVLPRLRTHKRQIDVILIGKREVAPQRAKFFKFILAFSYGRCEVNHKFVYFLDNLSVFWIPEHRILEGNAFKQALCVFICIGNLVSPINSPLSRMALLSCLSIAAWNFSIARFVCLQLSSQAFFNLYL